MNTEYNDNSLFDNLKISNDKLGFIFGTPGCGAGFIYKNEIFEAFAKTDDLIFTIDGGDSKCMVKKLGGITLNEYNVEAEIESADNYRLINFNITGRDEQIIKTILKYIDKRTKNESVTLLIRDFNEIAQNPNLFAKFRNLLEQNNIRTILEDCLFDELYQNEDFVKFMDKSKNFIFLTQPYTGREIIKEKFKVSDDLLEKIHCCEPGEGIVICNGKAENFRTKVDKRSPLYVLYTCLPEK